MSTTKTFIIAHPIHNEKYLIHACLEGPEVGVYYRGQSEITNGYSTTIHLKDYVSILANDFTIHLTQIYEGKFVRLASSEIHDNSFTVFSDNGNVRFYWIVHGSRGSIDAEPNRADVVVRGNGPYTWIE